MRRTIASGIGIETGVNGVTVVIGILGPAQTADHRRFVEQWHEQAVRDVLELPLPGTSKGHSNDGGTQYDPSYDWVITENYVGVDRRQRATPLVGSYMFRGRRRYVAPNLRELGIVFVDRVSPLGWAAARVLPATLALLAVLAWLSWTVPPETTTAQTVLSPTDDLLTWVLDPGDDS